MFIKNLLISFLAVFISSCGGGGGSGGPPLPSVSLSSNFSEVEVGSPVIITWSSTNASTCLASGAWTGSKNISGSEEITITNVGNNNFSLSCSGQSSTAGSNSLNITAYRFFSGKVVDGYIRGSEIFIDKNNNYILESSERSTTSNNNGSFELRFETGNLLSLGGFDLDSGNLMDGLMLSLPIDSYSESKILSPITSMILGMSDSSNLLPALGIDPSIDIEIIDPVAFKDNGDIYEFLYEKGNQLTVLAFSIQNIANNLNETTETSQDYFKSIAQELEAEFLATNKRVNIESPNFISNVLDNIESSKSLTLLDDNRGNIEAALVSLMPVIEVKSTENLTQSTLSFSTGTFQNDIINMANGTADSSRVDQYKNNILNLIAADQGVEPEQLMPGITAFDDVLSLDEDSSASINVLLNDSYLFGEDEPIITIGDATNGILLVNGNVITYTPSENFNGSDQAIYSITQNNQSSTAQITFNVNPVNDAPIISSNPQREIVEGVTNLSIVAFDYDNDDLTFSIAGDDVESFTITNTGVLSFIDKTIFTSPNDSDQDNIYKITVAVSDGVETTASEVAITILKFNTAPAFLSLPSTIVVPENTLFVYQIKSFDLEENTINYEISGANADAFNLSSSGLLSFRTAQDFENLSNNKFEFTITLSDSLLSSSRNIIVVVKNINENKYGESKLGVSKLE